MQIEDPNLKSFVCDFYILAIYKRLKGTLDDSMQSQ